LRNQAELIYYPVFKIVPSANNEEIIAEISSIDKFDWIIFTSRNTVRIFVEHLRRNRKEIGDKIKIAAIGKKTAEHLTELGYKVAFIPEEESSQGLIKELPTVIGKEDITILLPQGEEAPELLEKELSRLKYEVKKLNMYRTVATSPLELPPLESEMLDYIIFTSPLSVKFFQELGHVIKPATWVAAIGKPTAEALKEYYREADYIPTKADLSDIAAKIKELIGNEN
jgi:uroporphyrinogen-III synthase